MVPTARARYGLVVLGASLAFVAVACGGDNSSSTKAAATTATPATTAAAATATTTAPATAAGATTTAPYSAAGGDYGYGPTTAAPATTVAAGASGGSAAGATSLALVDNKLGKIVVDGQGYTLYLFEKDTGTTSNCNGNCATTWPPAMATGTGTPTVGAGLDASKVGTTARADGSMQLTYGGHPLYRYAQDSGPGMTTGQDVGSVWYVVGADGNKIDS